MNIWTVYDRPSDFPNSVIARRWWLTTATDDIIVGRTLDDIRDELKLKGLICLPRSELDDPKIVETWL